MEVLTLSKKVDLVNKTKQSGLVLELNTPMKKKPATLYQVITNMFKTKLIEHEVKDVLDGKTKYYEKTKCLKQSKRFILKEESIKIDIFDDEENIIYQKYLRNGKEYDLISYFYINKNKAIKRLIDENYKLLIKEIAFT